MILPLPFSDLHLDRPKPLELDPTICNACGLPHTVERRFLWWSWKGPHICRPLSARALAARHAFLIKCVNHYYQGLDEERADILRRIR